MKLYQMYLAERDGALVYYTDHGFVTFSIVPGGECYFSEIFVIPEKRNTRVPWQFYQFILSKAKEANCTHVKGSVDISTVNWKHSKALMLKLGFTPWYTEGPMWYWRKNL